MFENLFGNKQEKMMKESEQRQMDFQERQNSFAIGANPDHTEIINQEGKSDLIRWQQELDDDLIKLAYQLTGWTKLDGEWARAEGVMALCNDKFMNDVVVPQCTPFISRNLINSNLTEERILMDLQCTSNDIADNMADGYDKYGIIFTNYDVVLRLIKNTIKPGAFRALEGWTKKTDSTNFKRLETSMDRGMEEKKRSIFGIT